MEDTGADAAMGDAVGKRPLLGVGACAEGDNCGISDGWAVGTFELPSGKSFDKTNLQKNISNVDADIKNSLMAKLGTPASGGGKRRRTRKSNKKKKSKKSKSKKMKSIKKRRPTRKRRARKLSRAR